MAKYQKKPLVIEAEQFHPNEKPWPDGVVQTHNGFERYYYMGTLEGLHVVSPGDWIITGVKGEKYPCKPDIFDLTYELVREGR